MVGLSLPQRTPMKCITNGLPKIGSKSMTLFVIILSYQFYFSIDTHFMFDLDHFYYGVLKYKYTTLLFAFIF